MVHFEVLFHEYISGSPTIWHWTAEFQMGGCAPLDHGCNESGLTVKN